MRTETGNSRAADDGGGVLALGARDGHLVVEAGQERGHVAVGQAHELASVEVPLVLGVRVAGKAESRDQCGADLRINGSPSGATAEGRQTSISTQSANSRAVMGQV